MGLDGKVVVVTGSTRGIGRAIAEEAGRAGAIVVISSRTADAVAETVRELSAAGAAVSGFSANVGHWEEIDALKAHALETHGRIDVWFSNAGVSSGYQPLDEERQPRRSTTSSPSTCSVTSTARRRSFRTSASTAATS